MENNRITEQIIAHKPRRGERFGKNTEGMNMKSEQVTWTNTWQDDSDDDDEEEEAL
jgi:hypothetical protein